MVGREKDKGMRGVRVLVEKSARVSAEVAEGVSGGAGEYESGS